MIAILLIFIAASLQGRETLTLLPAALLTLKRTPLSCMDNEATLREKAQWKRIDVCFLSDIREGPRHSCI